MKTEKPMSFKMPPDKLPNPFGFGDFGDEDQDKRKRAIDMRRRGEHVEDIAELLDITTQVVRKWMGGARL